MTKRARENIMLVLLSIGHGTVDFYLSILQAVAPSLALHLGLPLGQVVALVGIATLVTNAVQPLAGYVMGSRNLAWILWAGLALSVAPTFMGWSTGMFSLTVVILLGAVGTGIFHPEGVLSAHDASGDRAHFGIPLFMAGGSSFSALAAPVGIYWAGHFGYHSMALLAIPGILLGLVFLFNHHSRRRKHPSIFLRPRSRRVTRMEKGRMSFWPLLAVSICFGLATGLLFAIFSSHYELTFGPEARTWAGWVLMVFGGFGAAASFVWGPLAGKVGYYRLVLVTQVLAAPLFFWLAHATSPVAGLLIALPLSIIAPGSVYPVSVTLSKTASGVTHALRTGLVIGGTWGSAAVAIMLAGWLLGRGVASNTFIIASGVCSLVAAALAAWQVVTGAAGGKPGGEEA